MTSNPEYTTTTELVLIFKSIYDQYSISSKGLAKCCGYIPCLHGDAVEVRRVRLVPMSMSYGMNESLDLTFHPLPASPNSRNIGIYEYEIAVEDIRVRFWMATSAFAFGGLFFGSNFLYCVERSKLKSFYKACLLLDRKMNDIIRPPILKEGVLQDIYDNSIGFLERASEQKELFKQYDIPVKRGILLVGHPGCGKTLTCKWLRQKCLEHNLDHRVVTMEEYRSAYQSNSIRDLFILDGDGLIFFDDMDIMFEDREKGNHHLTDFLTNLDGIEPRNGVVFVFTSNKQEDIDAAFIRPGRTDLVMTFESPDREMRKTFIEERYHSDILSHVDVDNLLDLTANSVINSNISFTFAELEEVRKLITLDYINTKSVDLEKSINEFSQHRQEFNSRGIPFGFASKLEDDRQRPVTPFENDAQFLN